MRYVSLASSLFCFSDARKFSSQIKGVSGVESLMDDCPPPLNVVQLEEDDVEPLPTSSAAVIADYDNLKIPTCSRSPRFASSSGSAYYANANRSSTFSSLLAKQ